MATWMTAMTWLLHCNCSRLLVARRTLLLWLIIWESVVLHAWWPVNCASWACWKARPTRLVLLTRREQLRLLASGSTCCSLFALIPAVLCRNSNAISFHSSGCSRVYSRLCQIAEGIQWGLWALDDFSFSTLIRRWSWSQGNFWCLPIHRTFYNRFLLTVCCRLVSIQICCLRFEAKIVLSHAVKFIRMLERCPCLLRSQKSMLEWFCLIDIREDSVISALHHVLIFSSV